MFFGYFLNIKKVTADFVLSPAKAGAFRFFHTRLPLSPRRLLPFGRISLRETGLAGYRPRLLGLPRKIRRGISLRETTLCGCPLRGHGFATPHRYFAVPVTAAPRRGPNGKNPALFGYFLNIKKVTPSADFAIGPAKAGAFLFSHTRLPLSTRLLLPFGRISPAAKPGWPVIGPAGAGAEAALPKAPPLTLPAQGPASRDFR